MNAESSLARNDTVPTRSASWPSRGNARLAIAAWALGLHEFGVLKIACAQNIAWRDGIDSYVVRSKFARQ